MAADMRQGCREGQGALEPGGLVRTGMGGVRGAVGCSGAGGSGCCGLQWGWGVQGKGPIGHSRNGDVGPELLWGTAGMGTAARHWAGTGLGTHVPRSGQAVAGWWCLPRVTLLAAGVQPAPGAAGPHLSSAGCQPGLSLRHWL